MTFCFFFNFFHTFYQIFININSLDKEANSESFMIELVMIDILPIELGFSKRSLNTSFFSFLVQPSQP